MSTSLSVYIMGEERVLTEALSVALRSRGLVAQVIPSDAVAMPSRASSPQVVILVGCRSCGHVRERLASARVCFPMAEIIVVGGDGNRTPLEHALKSMSQHLFRADSFERLVRALEILQGDPNSRRHAAELEDSLRGLTTRVSDIDPLSTGLTAREQEIFRAISAGLSNKEIANLLSISTNTVKNHVHSILTKLNVSRRHYVLGHIYIDRFFQALRLCRHPKSQVCEKLPV